LYAALLTGGVLHMVSYETSLNAGQLADYTARHPIDFLKIAPPHLQALLQSAAHHSILPRKRLVVGGDVSHWHWMERIAALHPACLIFNHYGPTEATVGVTTYPLDSPGERGVTGGVPIGRPFGNARAYILDRTLEPVPIGVVGELYLGGTPVTRGYLGRPGLTASSFVPDPFGTGGGERLYRTGDKARFLADGNIEFLGRSDAQVKIRGYRIEPEEIANVLLEHPAVHQAVVMASDGEKSERRLVAYAVLNDPASATPAGLRDYLAGRLPGYMVPAHVLLLDSLPRAAHGKLDRRRLPAPVGERPEIATAYESPGTATQEALVLIWTQVLELERVGIHDNFFELGGHSLLATRIVLRVREMLDVEVSLRAIFEAPTVREFAEHVETLRWANRESGVAATDVTEGDRQFEGVV
jgi:acyl-coenzyme A synthetase/AMP-(fatty) acid ligase/acyl carrier protein